MARISAAGESRARAKIRPGGKGGGLASAAVSARTLDRLCGALLGHDAPAAFHAGGGVVVVVEAGGIRRTLAFDAAAVAGAVSAGLAMLGPDGLALTSAGRSRYARAGEPDAPFLAQHRPLARASVATPEGEAVVLVDEAESPLAWLRRRRGRDGGALVTDDAFAAGERLRADFTRGNLMPRITANWQASVASGGRGAGALDFSDVVVAARQHVRRAMDAVGPDLAGVLLDVCCFLKGLEQVERERRWPVRSAKVVLAIALARLAAHYGIGLPMRSGAAPIRAWAQADARPGLRRPPG